MTMTIPTIPNLPAGYVATLTDLQNLCAMATFALTKPVAQIIDSTGGQTVVAAGGAVTSFGTNNFDTDGMYNSSAKDRLTIQTPGMYKVRYTLAVTSSTPVVNTFVQVVSGPNNPLGNGVNYNEVWGAGTLPISISGTIYGWASGGGVIPWYLYAGDYVQLWFFASAAGATLAHAAPAGINTAGVGSMLSLEYKSIV